MSAFVLMVVLTEGLVDPWVPAYGYEQVSGSYNLLSSMANPIRFPKSCHKPHVRRTAPLW